MSHSDLSNLIPSPSPDPSLSPPAKGVSDKYPTLKGGAYAVPFRAQYGEGYQARSKGDLRVVAVGGGEESLKVSRQPNDEPEIFHSLQGEGAAIGTPSVFLRLALCNLICEYCDTKYTWDWRHYDYKSEVIELSPEQVEENILKYDCQHLVITGGEPLLQQKGLAPLVRSLKEKGFSFEVETNGTIAPLSQLEQDIDQWNVSPKLATSGNALHRREVPQALDSFSRLPNAYFKFVAVEVSDMEEIRGLIQRYGLPRDRVILMPEGQTRAALQKRSLWLSQVCIEEGFRFTPRLHILLWGDKRGT